MKATVLLISAIFVLGSFGLASGQAVFVDVTEVVGLNGDLEIPEGIPTDLVIPVRFTNAIEDRSCISNGYVFASDNVNFGVVSGEWNPAYPWNMELGFPLMLYPWFDQGTFINYFENGVGFAGLSNAQDGLPADFDDIAYFITVPAVTGVAGEVFTMDSSFWMPANVWLWCGDETTYPSWGGPYDFVVGGEIIPDDPYTDCWPQPIEMGLLVNDRVLEVYIYNEDHNNVDLASIRVGNIPPYNPVQILADGVINTDCFIMRFLGSSGFRPLPPEGIQSTYPVSYNYISGGSNSLIGDFLLNAKMGDVNLDNVVDINDVQFMAEYFWNGGEQTQIQGETLYELMDVDGNGTVDIRDAIETIELAGL